MGKRFFCPIELLYSLFGDTLMTRKLSFVFIPRVVNEERGYQRNNSVVEKNVGWKTEYMSIKRLVPPVGLNLQNEEFDQIEWKLCIKLGYSASCNICISNQ